LTTGARGQRRRGSCRGRRGGGCRRRRCRGGGRGRRLLGRRGAAGRRGGRGRGGGGYGGAPHGANGGGATLTTTPAERIHVGVQEAYEPCIRCAGDGGRGRPVITGESAAARRRAAARRAVVVEGRGYRRLGGIVVEDA